MTRVVEKWTIQQTKRISCREKRLWIQREGEDEREGDAESGVGTCLLTESFKSMAVLMNISREKLVPSSAGIHSLTANVIEQRLKAAHD